MSDKGDWLRMLIEEDYRRWKEGTEFITCDEKEDK